MFTWKQLLRNPKVLLAAGMIIVCILVAVMAPVLAPPDNPEDPQPYKVVGSAVDPVPRPPSEEAILGTIPHQFDVYYSIIWGVRSALRFGLTVTLITAFLGTLLGAVSGYIGGVTNRVVMRITDAFLTFPPIVGVLLFQLLLTRIPYVAVGNQFTIPVTPTPMQEFLYGFDLNPVMVALVLLSWMKYARMVNGNVLQLKQAEFVIAAKSIGMSGGRIVVRHLLLNAISPIIVLAAKDVGGMVILDSAFAFVGASGYNKWGWGWGDMLVESRSWIVGVGGNPLDYWWVFIPATLALIFFSVSWNLLGNGLNDVANPYKHTKLDTDLG